MRKLLEQLKLLTEMFEEGSLAYKSYDLKAVRLIQRIKKYDAKHPFANLGLPTEDYQLLQQVLKS
tara:strand:+ start:141 stop:335 length:195 start_codon:yes stop_codon:yes gene_type:complete